MSQPSCHLCDHQFEEQEARIVGLVDGVFKQTCLSVADCKQRRLTRDRLTPSLEISLEIVARCWCDPTTEHLTMVPELARAFAKRLDTLFVQLEKAHNLIKYAPLSHTHPHCGQALWVQSAERIRAEYQNLLQGNKQDGTPL